RLLVPPQKRPDDLAHVAARAERTPGAGEDDGPDVAAVRERAQRVRELAVDVEGERVHGLGAVQAQGRHRARLLEAEAAWVHDAASSSERLTLTSRRLTRAR